MAEEFQAAGICGDNSWWSNNIDSTRSASSPCSVAGGATDAGNCGTWQTREEQTNNLVSADHSNYQKLGFPDARNKPHKNESPHGGSSGSILIDSTLQMMGFGLSSSSSPNNWDHQSLFRCNERAPERNFHSVLQEEAGIDSSSNSQIQKDWMSGCGSQVSNVDIFKPMNQEFSSGIGSAASYGSPSTLIQSLYDDPNPQQQQPPPQHTSLFTNNRSMSYSSTANYGASSNEISPIWSNNKVSSFLKPSSSMAMPKQEMQPPNLGLHFSNNTLFWNASAEALNDIRAGAFASSQPQYNKTPTFEDKPSCCPSILLNKVKSEDHPLDSASMAKKNVCELAFKRPRIETPSPLPTFKVRKEKLGDRVTALQQLVSPFGKTDTASVLHEAIEYIKFLHDQVSVLSTPYMKSGVPIQRQQGCDDTKESEGPKQDLRSRGLCLVPISSTFPVATEATTDFWTPTLSFGGALLR